MIAFLNGQFIPAESAMVSVFDRGFLYGDGLFETLLIRNGKPFRWEAHLERLRRGAAFLKLRLPMDSVQMRAACDSLIERNRMPDAILRITVSRGIGERGYSPRGAEAPTVAMSLHTAPPVDPPPQWQLHTASLRIPAGDALAQHKTANKLVQVLARADAEAHGADEALLVNTANEVVETASGNLFWVEGGTVCTPPLATGALPGITRAVVLDLCQQLDIPVAERSAGPDQLGRAEGVFATLSSLGLVEVTSLDRRPVPASPLTGSLHRAYWDQVARETGPARQQA